MVLKAVLYDLCVVFVIFTISWKMTLFMLAILSPIMFYAKCMGGKFRELAKKVADFTA